MEASDTQLSVLDVMIIKKEKRFSWIFIQNQWTQTDMSPSDQPTLSIA